jgi:predicted unusual protein kinase regulating ubiquinone biosynthesis (AarF/ABC1/UbiB family)
MASAIDEALSGEEGGQSRFGALATGLGAMSGTYKFLTPPYIVLLVRTFLTLEGIAAKADPDFNIYTASLPYAIRRAMAPATPEGRKAMRAAFLNEHDNSVRWERITELVGGAGKSGAGDESEVAAKTDHEMENEIFADLVSGSSIELETEINTDRRREPGRGGGCDDRPDGGSGGFDAERGHGHRRGRRRV